MSKSLKIIFLEQKLNKGEITSNLFLTYQIVEKQWSNSELCFINSFFLCSAMNFSWSVCFILKVHRKYKINQAKNYKCISSIVGSVVECSPATRAARVRFPDDAKSFTFLVPIVHLLLNIKQFNFRHLSPCENIKHLSIFKRKHLNFTLSTST